jgi:predicted DNA-binding protein
MSTITARIPTELNNSLSSIAKTMERPKSFLIHKAIEKYLNEVKEDIADAEIALSRMKKKDRKIYAPEEVRDFIRLNCAK